MGGGLHTTLLLISGLALVGVVALGLVLWLIRKK
jgi:uncharacterized iron-regulated membrane protein